MHSSRAESDVCCLQVQGNRRGRLRTSLAAALPPRGGILLRLGSFRTLDPLCLFCKKMRLNLFFFCKSGKAPFKGPSHRVFRRTLRYIEREPFWSTPSVVNSTRFGHSNSTQGSLQRAQDYGMGLRYGTPLATGYKSPMVFHKMVRDDDTGRARCVTADIYIRRCLAPVVKAILKKKIVFRHDGARPHIRGEAYLRAKDVETMASLASVPWPPYRPDLNMIEGCGRNWTSGWLWDPRAPWRT